MANYILNDHDLDTLDALIQQAIKDARNDTTVSDDVLAHYYSLRGKVAKLSERRSTPKEPRAPRKPRKTRRSSTAPEPGAV